MQLREEGTPTVFNFTQPWKQCDPIVVTEEGMDIDSKLTHLQNAEPPIVVTVSGIDIDVSE